MLKFTNANIKDPSCRNQYTDLLCEAVDQFMHGAVFNAGGYFRADRYPLACGSFLVSLSSLMLNLIWPWE